MKNYNIYDGDQKKDKREGNGKVIYCSGDVHEGIGKMI